MLDVMEVWTAFSFVPSFDESVIKMRTFCECQLTVKKHGYFGKYNLEILNHPHSQHSGS